VRSWWLAEKQLQNIRLAK